MSEENKEYEDLFAPMELRDATGKKLTKDELQELLRANEESLKQNHQYVRDNFDDPMFAEIRKVHFERLCELGIHSFELIDTYTGGATYKCRHCGLVDDSKTLPNDDFYRKYEGSIFGETSYMWQEIWQPSDIISFEISFGDYPIRYFAYKDRTVTYKNKINGSRDGGKSFPENFLKENQYRLIDEQTASLYNKLSAIYTEHWKTDSSVFEKLQCCGFCLKERFTCTLKNGYKFDYMTFEPVNGFKELANYLCELCGFEIAYGNQNAGIKKNKNAIDGIITGCCNIGVPSLAKFCPMCGKEIDFASSKTEQIEYDDMQTMRGCIKCSALSPFEHKYCIYCGEKLTW